VVVDTIQDAIQFYARADLGALRRTMLDPKDLDPLDIH
jgi:hypothetical protein